MSHAKASRGMCSQEISVRSLHRPADAAAELNRMPLQVESSYRQTVIDWLNFAYEKSLSSLEPVDLSRHDVALSNGQNADREP